MRILFVTQIFLPEMGALSNRLYPLVERFVAAGHEVFVATGMPNYPKGIVFDDYRGKRTMREERDGYTVLRTSYYTTPRNQSKWAQLRSYLGFIPAALRSGWRAGKLDVVFVTSPPIFTLIPAIILAKLRGARLVLDVRDLWPDELITYGGFRENSLAVSGVRAVERLGYRTAELVTATTGTIVETIVERGVPAERAFFLPNGADVELFRPLPSENTVAAEYPFGDRFVVMYAGLFGIKHSLEVMLEAAALLREHKEIVFFLLGGGARRDALMEYAKEKQLDNVIFGEERSVREVPAIMARADVCFAAVRPEQYPKKVISVKVFEYLACEKPVVGALGGESARVLEQSGGGIVVAPGDARATADAILTLYRDPLRRAAMGKSGRRYVEENYSRSAWAARLEKAVVKLCDRKEKKDETRALFLPEDNCSPEATE
ncbi:MAG TPA: glycosyltransferase family 4 protein [Pyrinomonadaceae bacterium]|jgi:glycosyltransferase involved in cell wall biosynthesis